MRMPGATQSGPTTTSLPASLVFRDSIDAASKAMPASLTSECVNRGRSRT